MAKHTRKRTAQEARAGLSTGSQGVQGSADGQRSMAMPGAMLMPSAEGFGNMRRRQSRMKRYFYMFLLFLAAAVLIYFILSRCGKSKKDDISTIASNMTKYYI
jgi:hypothetical protein